MDTAKKPGSSMCSPDRRSQRRQLLAVPLSLGGSLLAQQEKGRKSKEKRSSGVSVSWLPIKPSSMDQTQGVTNNIPNTRREPAL